MNISILGSTGSIGTQTLEVIRASAGRLGVQSLAAHSSVEQLEQQIREFKPAIAVLMDENSALELKNRVRDLQVQVLAGMDGLIQAAVSPNTDTVVTAVSGRIGLEPTLAALKAKKNIALANKETLVAAGELVMKTAQDNGCSIIPVDSEHSAIFQCLYDKKSLVKKIVLTASGGPFLGWKKEKLSTVTKEMALKHPNWAMGAKITIDSATMMNKALEVIEAKFLFGLEYGEISIIVHPQSIVHSMVEYVDGSVIAQMGVPDMRLPIQYALSYPDRWPLCFQQLDLTGKTLTFLQPDEEAFPSIKLAYECGQKGGTLPAVMNASNEICVHAFLDGRIQYLEMFEIIQQICREHQILTADSLTKILAADLWARERSEEIISDRSQ